MRHDDDQPELPEPTGNEGDLPRVEPLHLRVTFSLAAGSIHFEWTRGGGDEPPIMAQGRLSPSETNLPWMVLDWQMDVDGKPRNGFCGPHTSSIRALLTRIRKTLPLADELPRLGLLTDANLGPARANVFFPLLTARTGNENTKLKTAGRLAAAQAEHARRRADQVARHEIRAQAHLDSLMLISESAWRAGLKVEIAHRPQSLSALFIPRARRWRVAEEAGGT